MIGAPVVLHRSPQVVQLGVTNNSDATIYGKKLDPREKNLIHRPAGYSVVDLQYPPARVLIHIETADVAGLELDGLPRGVIAVAPETKSFFVVGVHKRKFLFKRTQLPLTAGCVSSVYRSQGQTLKFIILEIRPPVSGGLDKAAVYVALSRATGLEDIFLLFPAALDDLTQPRDKDVVALITYVQGL